MSTTILHVSDTHHGLFAGLFPPEIELVYLNNERKTHKASSTSLWVWDNYQRLISTAIDFAEKDPVIVIHTGDICHGAQFAEYLYSGWPEHQVAIAVRCLSELRRIPTLQGIRLCYGTAAHDYGMASTSRQVADLVAPWGYGLWCGAYGVENIDGGQVDYAHRGPGNAHGEDPQLAARRYAIRLCRGMLERGKLAPVAILRGHVHRKTLGYVEIPWGKSGWTSTISVAAPLCGHNEFARNATQNTPFTEVGGALIRIHNGRVVEQIAPTWEIENRQTVDGCLAHPFTGQV